MGTRHPGVDAYIAGAPDYAKPILEHVRAVAHEAIPAVDEAIKWGAPHFMRDGMVCAIAAFKSYCGIRFWKEALLQADDASKQAIERYGRIASIEDIANDRGLAQMMKAAARLNADGVKLPSRPKKAHPPLEVPAALRLALDADRTAAATFDGFSPSHQREYVQWITEAKTEQTRDKRIATAIEWMAEGKSRNWKYERKG